MNAVEISKKIIEELGSTLEGVDPVQTDEVVKAILDAEKIFVAGAGRSLLMIRGLAMRLMHMGFEAYVVGETVTPAIGEKDLLIIASGSGETGTLRVMAEKAKKTGAKLAVITIYPDSTIGKLSDYAVRVEAACTKGDRESKTSIQPGANTFEQSVLLLGDAIVIQIIGIRDIHGENEVLMKRHANLE